MSTGLSNFPTDKEWIDELRRAPSSKAGLDPNEDRWGFLEPENGDHPILHLPREHDEYSIVPHESNTNLIVVPARNDNHPRVQLFKIPGAERSDWEFSLRTLLPNGDADYRRFRDRDRLHFGDKAFVFNDTITLDGAFIKYQHIEGCGSVSGGFGYVTKVALRADPNVHVALKVVRSKNPGVNKKVSNTYEISSLRALNHPHVCRLIEIFATKSLDLHMVMEYAELPNLAERITTHDLFLNGARPLSVDVFAGSSIFQLCTAMKYIHSEGIMHRDIKPANLLFTSMYPLTLKVADLGSATRETRSKRYSGTPHYMAPEIMSTPDYDRSVDLYSVGAVTLDILLAMQNGKNPLEAWRRNLNGREPNADDIIKLAEHRNTCLQTDRNLQMADRRALALAEGLLRYEPHTRISWAVALNNSWLQEMDSRRRIAPQIQLTPTESANGSTAELASVASRELVEELTVRRETTPTIQREVTPGMSHHDTTLVSPAPLVAVPTVHPADIQSVAQPVEVPVEANVRELQLKRRSSRIAKLARDEAIVRPYWLYRSGWEREPPPP